MIFNYSDTHESKLVTSVVMYVVQYRQVGLRLRVDKSGSNCFFSKLVVREKVMPAPSTDSVAGAARESIASAA